MTVETMSGGCQCGAVRFSAGIDLSAAGVCHCRMCQKATGGFFGAFVTAPNGVVWTRGAPKYFQSSDVARRGFCGDCGTPLTFESDGLAPELAIAVFDNPTAIAPVIQLALESKIPWVDGLSDLPTRSPEATAEAAARQAGIRSFQHPDRDTERRRDG